MSARSAGWPGLVRSDADGRSPRLQGGASPFDQGLEWGVAVGAGRRRIERLRPRRSALREADGVCQLREDVRPSDRYLWP